MIVNIHVAMQVLKKLIQSEKAREPADATGNQYLILKREIVKLRREMDEEFA